LLDHITALLGGFKEEKGEKIALARLSDEA
jgi:hypothetical protein